MDVLPIDIILCILKINTKNIHENLIKWRRALPLLSICRSWRAVAREKIYSYAFIINSTANPAYKHIVDRSLLTQGCGSLARWSNIGLIIQNGFQRSVTNMLICTLESKRYLTPLMCALYLLPLDNKDYPEIKLLESAACAIQKRQKIDKKVKFNYYLAAAKIGSAFANTFSNVTVLHIVSTFASRTLHSFYSAVIERYIDQLVRIEYDAPNYFPFPWTATKLVLLNIHLSGHDDNNKPLLINPHNLVSLHIFNDMLEFQCEWFHWDKHSNTIVFENLEVLDIIGGLMDSVYEDRDQYDDNDFQLKLPKIKSIHIIQSYISLTTMNYFLKSAEFFLYEGMTKDTLCVCRLGVSNLTEMFIKIDLVKLEDYCQEFIETTNEIFQLTYGISKVYCKLVLDNSFLDHTQIYWPFLTLLSITPGNKIDCIIPLLSCLPNLLDLFINVRGYDEQQMEHTRGVFMNIKQDYSEPLLSKIKDIKLSASTMSCIKYFADAFPILKWYIPSLKQVRTSDNSSSTRHIF